MPATFQTLDWVNEPERIKRAFNIKGDCEFIGRDHETMVLRQNNLTHIALNECEDVFLYCNYYQQIGRHFGLMREVEDKRTIVTCAVIEWNGQSSPVGNDQTYSYATLLAKGLFHLGILTPEVEAELHVSISAHQKVEWTLEYQRRVGSSV